MASSCGGYMPVAATPSHIGIQIPTSRQCRKYARAFMETGCGQQERVTAGAARTFFERAGLPREHLARIWELSKRDNESSLCWPEFVAAMTLIRSVRKGCPLPDPSVGLPQALINFLASLVEPPSQLATQGSRANAHAMRMGASNVACFGGKHPSSPNEDHSVARFGESSPFPSSCTAQPFESGAHATDFIFADKSSPNDIKENRKEKKQKRDKKKDDFGGCSGDGDDGHPGGHDGFNPGGDSSDQGQAHAWRDDNYSENFNGGFESDANKFGPSSGRQRSREALGDGRRDGIGSCGSFGRDRSNANPSPSSRSPASTVATSLPSPQARLAELLPESRKTRTSHVRDDADVDLVYEARLREILLGGSRGSRACGSGAANSVAAVDGTTIRPPIFSDQASLRGCPGISTPRSGYARPDLHLRIASAESGLPSKITSPFLNTITPNFRGGDACGALMSSMSDVLSGEPHVRRTLFAGASLQDRGRSLAIQAPSPNREDRWHWPVEPLRVEPPDLMAHKLRLRQTLVALPPAFAQ